MAKDRENKVVKPPKEKGSQPHQGVRPNRSANKPPPPPPPTRGDD